MSDQRSDAPVGNQGDNDPDDNQEYNDHSHVYNARNRRISYSFWFANRTNRSDDPNSYETQFTQFHQISELPPEDDIKKHKEYRDYTVENVKEGITNIDNDPQDDLQFIIHYIFT